MNADNVPTTNTIGAIALLLALNLILKGRSAEGGAMATGAFALLTHHLPDLDSPHPPEAVTSVTER